MENFFKKLTNKLSSEYVVELVDDGKVIEDDLLKSNVKEGVDEINAKSYMELDATSKFNSSSRKLNEPEEKIIEKDSKDSDSANSDLNVENANEVQEEHSKPRRNRDLTFFF